MTMCPECQLEHPRFPLNSQEKDCLAALKAEVARLRAKHRETHGEIAKERVTLRAENTQQQAEIARLRLALSQEQEKGADMVEENRRLRRVREELSRLVFALGTHPDQRDLLAPAHAALAGAKEGT